MNIGSVIKKYRKVSGFTQEEMANRLGVTTPAVNKWENGNSNPDIELLAPIARLLHISLDTLLSFHENLTDVEITELIQEMDKMFSVEGYEKTYQWAVNIIKDYPNCNMLIWQVAVMLDSRRIIGQCEHPDKYDEQINFWYEIALNDKDEKIQHHAADSLFGFYLRKGNYEMAEKYNRIVVCMLSAVGKTVTDIPVTGEQGIEVGGYPVIFFFDMSLHHHRNLPPFIRQVKAGFCGPVLWQPVPGDHFLFRDIRAVDPCIKFAKPRFFGGSAVHFLQGQRGGVFGSSERRDIKGLHIQFCKFFGKVIYFFPSFWRQGVDGIIGISVTDDQ